jgi:hypothetical protein
VLPNVETGADGLGVRITGGGLRPPAPSSVEPSGIPSRLTDDADPIPVGDEADAAGPAKELLPIAAQLPDAVPAMPPPSKTEVEPDIPAVDVPVPEDVPVIELPPIPKDVCGIEPPMPEQMELLPVVGPTGEVPDVIGLTPGDASSVAPRGMPAGAPGEPGPMPRGEVMPSGEGPGEMLIPPTCAKAAPQPKKTAAVVAIIKRVIVGSTSFLHRTSPRAAPEALPREKINRTHGHYFARIAAICAILRRSEHATGI